VRLSLLPVSFLAWAIGVAETNTTTLGGYGLPANLSVIFYAGLALLIISAGIELARAELSHRRLALHAGLLVLMLYGTAAVVYAEPRYSWFYKTAGVVQYIKVNGHLTAGIDIYQSWAGFFALDAWFDRVAGVSTPVNYGNWAQLVFELAALPLLYSIYTSLGLSARQRWLGILLYSAGNWIAQDYLSPQALATVLSLGIMAFVLRWMPAADSVVAPPQEQEADGAPGGERRGRGGHRRARHRDGVLGSAEAPLMTALLLLVFALVFTHELSPYIITAQLAVLALLKQIRPRWIPLAVAAITIGYLLPNFSYVDSHYGLLSSIGNFFGNVQSPSSLNGGTIPESQHIIADSADLLSAMIWLLALAGAWLMRASRRRAIALLLLTFSPILVLFGGAYGNEGILRVYLFSLPWAAALAATALVPFRPRELIPARLLEKAGNRTLGRLLARPPKLGRLDLGILMPPLALALAAALFLPAFYGNDAMNVFSVSEVTTTNSFLQSAKPGMVLGAMDNGSLAFTAKYNQFPLGTIFGQYGVVETDPAKMNIATYLARTVVNYTNGLSPGYVLMTPSMQAENAEYGYVPANYLTMLADSLRTSKYWKPIFSDDGTVVYEITAAANDIPAGSYNSNPLLSVP
jgi:hypothetical protein